MNSPDGSSATPQAMAPPACRVLILDDDPDCLTEYAEVVEALGYDSVTTGDATTALRVLANDPEIAIIVTDLNMPAMDGIAFLEEVSARFAYIRPIAAIVITGHGSLERAVDAMRLQAVDFLTKPITHKELSAALKRAASRWAQHYGKRQLALMYSAIRPTQPPPMPAGNTEQTSPAQLKAIVRRIVKSRNERASIFGADLFGDPAWDILLDLTSARLEGHPVPVSSACAAAAIPLTTALRWIGHLVEAGLISRWQDPSDKRRNLVEISDEAFDAMVKFIIATYSSKGGL